MNDLAIGSKDIRKNKNGITLIALVITIIVLLILAGISINALARRQWNDNKSSTS